MYSPQSSLYCSIILLLYFSFFGYLSLVFLLPTNTKTIFFFLNLQESSTMVAIALGVHTDLCIKLCINSKEFLSLFHFLNNYCNHASLPPQPLCATIFPTHHLKWRHVVIDNIFLFMDLLHNLYNSEHQLLHYPTFPSVENPTRHISMDLSSYFIILIYIYWILRLKRNTSRSMSSYKNILPSALLSWYYRLCIYKKWNCC